MAQDSEKPDFFSRPILAVADVSAGVDYYCSKLGFSLSWTGCDAEHPVIAAVERAGICLILDAGSALPASSRPAVVAAELFEHVNLAQLHAELSQRGAKVRRAPFQVPWQPKVHQLEVEDLDGNLLLFWGDLP